LTSLPLRQDMSKEKKLKTIQHLEDLGPNSEKVIGRILAFSDGVFAFAITLLILDVRLPADTLKANLGSALISLWPNYLAFLLSFFVIGLYWSAHVRLFREIVRYDQNLIWLNLLYLLFIVIIPFSTSVLSLHLIQLSVIVYAALMACAGYMHTVLRLYTGHHRYLGEKCSSSYIRRGVLLSLIAPAGFTVSIGITFFSTLAAQLFWFIILLIHIVFQRLLKPQNCDIP
jgi:uncharacterized membrane protein